MKRVVLVVAVSAALGALVAIGYPLLFPSESDRIRAQLHQLVSEADAPPASGMEGLARAAKIGSAFADDAILDFGDAPPIQGREAVMAIASRLQDRTRTMRIELRDVDVNVAPDGAAADVRLTVVVASDDNTDAREFQLQMIKREARWVIARATAVPVLQK